MNYDLRSGRCIFFSILVATIAVFLVFTVIMIPASATTATSGDYTLSLDDGKATITGYSGSAVNLDIPSSFVISETSYTTVGVAADAFSGRSTIKTIAIPGTVTTIASKAFYGLANLESFSVADSNQKFVSPSGVLYENGTDGMPAVLKQYPRNAEGSIYQLLPTTAEIDSYAFSQVSGLETVTMSVQLLTIGEHAFEGCIKIKQIVLGAGVSRIGDQAFYDMDALQYIDVDPANTSYYSDNGVLYEGKVISGTFYKNHTLVIFPKKNPGLDLQYADDAFVTGIYQFPYKDVDGDGVFTRYVDKPDMVVYAIPFDTYSIKANAFEGSGIEYLAFTEQIQTIGDSAFKDCKGLQWVYLPSSVTSIGAYAFSGCSSIISAYVPAIDMENGHEFEGCNKLALFYLQGISGTVKISTTTLPTKDASGTKLTKWTPWSYCATSAGSEVDLSDAVTLDKGTAYMRNSVSGYSFTHWEVITGPDVYAHSYTKSGAPTLVTFLTGSGRVDTPSQSQAINGNTKHLVYPVSLTTIFAKSYQGVRSPLVVLPSEAVNIQYEALQTTWAGLVVIGKDMRTTYQGPFSVTPWVSYIVSPKNTNLYSYDNALYIKDGSTTKLLAAGRQDSDLLVSPIGTSGYSSCSARANNRNITFPETPWSHTEDFSMWARSSNVDYFHAFKLVRSQYSREWSGYSSIIEIGAGSEIGNSGASNDTPRIVCLIADTTFPASAINRIQYNGLYDVSTDNLVTQTSTIQEGHMYLQSGYDKLPHASIAGTGITWWVVDKTLIIRADGTGTGIIPDYKLTLNADSKLVSTAPWHDYLDGGTVKAILVSENVVTVGDYAFYTVGSSVEMISLPYGLVSIGKQAFSGCMIPSQYIPNSVTSIENDAFRGCSKLANIVYYDYYNYSYETGDTEVYPYRNLGVKFVWQTSPVFNTEGGILYKGDEAWIIPEALSSISLKNSCTSIAPYAGYNSQATSLRLASATGQIGEFAFYGADLEKVELTSDQGSGLSIFAFADCDSLGIIKITGEVTLPNRIFDGCDSVSQIDLSSATGIEYSTTYPEGYPDQDKETSPHGVFPAGTYFRSGVYSGSVTDTNLTWLTVGYLYTSEALALRSCSNDGSLKFTVVDDSLIIVYDDTVTGGTGKMKDYTEGGTPWYGFRNSIKSVTLPQGISHLGDYAFSQLSQLPALTYPESLSSLGKYCFAGSSIDAIPTFLGQVTEYPEGMMKGCSSLTSISIPSAVSKIGKDAFSGCFNLARVDYVNTVEPASPIVLDTGAFSTGGSSLTVNSSFEQPTKEWSPFATKPSADLTLKMSYAAGDGVTWYVDDSTLTFERTTATAIPDYASLNNVPWKPVYGSRITAISFPSEIVTIGTFAFAGCTALESYSIPATVTTVKSDALSGCSGLRTVTIPFESPAITLSTGVFRDLTKLYTVNMPANLCLDSDHQAFTGCTGIREINLTSSPGYAYTVGGNAYAPWMVTQSALTVTTTKDVTSLGDYMFKGCTKLEVLKLDEKTVSLGQSALEGCTGLKELDMSKLSTIGTDALKDLSGIKTLTMPLSMTDDDIFGGTSCQALELVNLTGDVCPDYTCAAVDGGGTSTYLNAPWQKVNQNNVVVTLMDSVDKIGDFFMYECDYVQIFTVPSSAGSIGDHAFYGCGQLAVINLLTTTAYPMDKIDSYAFETKIYDPDPSDENAKGTTLCCRFANSITIGDVPMEWIEALYTNGKATKPVYPIAEGATATTLYYENGIPYKQCGKSLYVKWTPGGNTVFFLGTGDMYPFTDDTGHTPGSAEFIRPWQVASWTVEGETIYHQYEGITITQSMLDAITAVSFCDGMTSIGDKAFYGLVNLSDASVPSTVKKIGEYAFYSCSLTGYQDLTNVTVVGTHAFEGNDTLDWIKLPYDATVGADAFKGCDGVYLYATGTQGKSPAPTTVSYPEAAKPLRVIMLSGVEANFVNQDGLAFVPGSVWSTSGGLATSIAQGKVYIAGDAEDYESKDNVYTASTSSTISFS